MAGGELFVGPEKQRNQAETAGNSNRICAWTVMVKRRFFCDHVWPFLTMFCAIVEGDRSLLYCTKFGSTVAMTKEFITMTIVRCEGYFLI